MVSFKAIASTDLHHGVTLSDPACRNFGLRLGQESDSAEQTVGLFLHTLATQAPHWTWRSVSGTFIGVVQINPAGERRFIPSAVRDFKEVAYEP
ncbi:hypothetical protein [Luteimonas composti]|uniref:hypothetical protein n=1 Tax=Luteimonas composti TaxID=398257 RepID=UPI0036DDA274